MTGIIIGLFLLMLLTYFGMSIIWVAPLASLVVALFGGLELLPSYTQSYMGGFAKYVLDWFPVFALGAIFGKLMEVSGAAKSLAVWMSNLIGHKRAILAVVVVGAFLTYGGISLFVVVFVLYPMGMALFREANITRRLLPGAISLGAFTFTMTAIPGTPQIQNLIPMKYFGTTQMAAPTLGIVASLIMFVCGMLYLSYRARVYAAAGVGFVEPEQETENLFSLKLPAWYLSFIPPTVIVLLFNIFELDIVIALSVGVLCALLLFAKSLLPINNMIKVLNSGANSSLIAIINTSAAVGFGSVVRDVPAFKGLADSLVSLWGSSPLISEGVSVTLLAGATGSASGGLGIALEALGAKYLEIATSLGISPEVLHRVAAVACGGLDTLPHNGAVLTLLAVCAMSHKESYMDIFVCCTVLPLLALAAIIVLGSMGVV